MPSDPTVPAAAWPGRLAEPRHVWLDVTGGNLPPSPGLLLMWRHVVGPAGGWEAWVISVSRGVVRQGWESAHHVTPYAGEATTRHVRVAGPGMRDGGPGLLVDWRPINRVEGTREAWVVWASYQSAHEHLGVRMEWMPGERVEVLPLGRGGVA